MRNNALLFALTLLCALGACSAEKDRAAVVDTTLPNGAAMAASDPTMAGNENDNAMMDNMNAVDGTMADNSAMSSGGALSSAPVDSYGSGSMSSDQPISEAADQDNQSGD